MNRRTEHHHHHAADHYNRAFALGVGLNVVFVIVEVLYGMRADSLALITDAGHNVSDVMGLLLAWGANALAGRRPSARRTYGYSRATILASLASALLLLSAVGAIAWEAFHRLFTPVAPVGQTIMWVAAVGVVINFATAFLFYSGKDRDLNIRGAYLHMAADGAVSLGVVISGGLIWKFGLNWVDPVSSLLIAAVIFLSTWGLLRDSLNLAVDAVPPEVQPEAVRRFLRAQPGVQGLHDLHIWAMSTTETALTVHMVMAEYPQDDRFLHGLADELQRRFDINHPTIQLELGEEAEDCHQAEHCAH